MNIATRRTLLPALAVAIALLPGCILAAVGIGAGVVAATSEDTARVDLRAGPDAVFQQAVALVEDRGVVTSTDEANRRLMGEIDGSKVEIHVFPVNEFSRVTVKARKLGGTLPDLDLAELLATDITHSF